MRKAPARVKNKNIKRWKDLIIYNDTRLLMRLPMCMEYFITLIILIINIFFTFQNLIPKILELSEYVIEKIYALFNVFQITKIIVYN